MGFPYHRRSTRRLSKSQSDCFFENTFPMAIKFAEYEQDLLLNLNALLTQLKSDAGFADNAALLGAPVIAKETLYS